MEPESLIDQWILAELGLSGLAVTVLNYSAVNGRLGFCYCLNGTRGGIRIEVYGSLLIHILGVQASNEAA